MIDRDFVDAIQELSEGASGIQEFTAPGDEGRRVRVYDRKKNEIGVIEGTAMPRVDTVHRIEDIVSVTTRRLAEKRLADAGVSAEVFVGDERIVSVFTEAAGFRGESVSLPLHRNAAYEAVKTLAKQPRWFEHQDFVDFLRITLAGCVNPNDFKTFKSLRFQNADNGASTVNVGRESMDRSINRATLTGDGADIPETITLDIPVYDECLDYGNLLRWDVTCAVAIDTQNRRVTIRPMAHELDAAAREAKTWLLSRLDGVPEGVLCVTGSPSPA